MAEERLTFEQRYEEICREIEKRRYRWTLTALEFDDVKQIILTHVWKKYGKFNPNKVVGGKRVEFLHWVNRLISNQIKLILRDHYYKFNRPCISGNYGRGCPHNLGSNQCAITPSKLQCRECPIYKKWEDRKINHFNIQQPLSMEHHQFEVGERIDAHFASTNDVAAKKKILDQRIMQKLNVRERKIYRMLYIKGMKEEDVGRAMGYKKVGRLKIGYLPVLAVKHRIKAIALQVIQEEGLM